MLLLASALNGIPLLDQPDSPGIGGGRRMSWDQRWFDVIC
jgi:hypothetical protein